MRPVKLREPERETPVVNEVDVLIAGGGTAGLVAAVAAARNGARTLLVERYGFLGGDATTPKGFLSFCMDGKQVIGGIPQEVVSRLVQRNASLGHQLIPHVEKRLTVTPYDQEVFKCLALEMVEEAGVELMLHSWIAMPIVEQNSIKGLFIETKSGRSAVLGRVVVDSTGDGDVAARAGAPFHEGREEDGLMQSLSLLLVLGGVDRDKLVRLLSKERLAPLSERGMTFYDVFEAAKGRIGFSDLYKKARENGDLPDSVFGVEAGHVYAMGRDGEVGTIMCRVHLVDATNASDLTRAEVATRKQVLPIVHFFRKYVPGFENAYLLRVAHQVGVRETRQIMGEYVLTADDIRNGRRFPDAIAKGAWPIDMASVTQRKDRSGMERTWKEGCIPSGAYDIPYRCLLPKKIENLLIAGRCISATHEAMAAARVMATCMAIGQASGTAAALSVKENVTPRRLDVAGLQRKLRDQGAILDWNRRVSPSGGPE